MAAALGGSFSVNSTSLNGVAGYLNANSELLTGVTSFPCDFIATMSYSGSAVPVVGITKTDIFLVDQAIGNGRFTALADVNGLHAGGASIEQFLHNLFAYAVQSQNKVMNNEAPNAGFGGSPTYTVSAPMVSQSDAGKSAYSFKVTYKSQNASIFDETTIGTNDVTVKNASGTALTVTGASVTSGTSTKEITVTYTVTPPGGAWDAADNGGYTIALANAAVSTADGKTTGGNNSAGSFTVDLSAAPLEPAMPDPFITAPELDQTITVRVGKTCAMSVTAKNATNYQWYVNRGDGRDFANLTGATGTDYTTAAVTLANDGYQYRCVVSGSAGTTAVTSKVFTLRVIEEAVVPTTGDGSTPLLWIGLILLSAAGLTASAAVSKRRHKA